MVPDEVAAHPATASDPAATAPTVRTCRLLTPGAARSVPVFSLTCYLVSSLRVVLFLGNGVRPDGVHPSCTEKTFGYCSGTGTRTWPVSSATSSSASDAGVPETVPSTEAVPA